MESKRNNTLLCPVNGFTLANLLVLIVELINIDLINTYATQFRHPASYVVET